jgi:ElaB/YqjD/DUF883 family membrane-anchored ribosome-binding protein
MTGMALISRSAFLQPLAQRVNSTIGDAFMRNDTQLQESIEALRKDFSAVAHDTEALLKATADVANERIQEIRTRTQSTLQQARDSFDAATWSERVRHVATDADVYVSDHKWGFIGAAAGTGLLLGLLARRH